MKDALKSIKFLLIGYIFFLGFNTFISMVLSVIMAILSTTKELGVGY